MAFNELNIKNRGYSEGQQDDEPGLDPNYKKLIEDRIMTPEMLAKAIGRSPYIKDTSYDISDERAGEIAIAVSNFFGYSDMIIDNSIESDERSMFYILEDAKILTTDREEVTMFDGREWRIHRFLFDWANIRAILTDKKKAPEANAEFYEDFFKNNELAH